MSDIINTERLKIRIPDSTDAATAVNFYTRNRDHLKEWEPSRSQEFYTEVYWNKTLHEACLKAKEDKGYLFFVFLINTEDLVAIINLSNIERYSFQNGRLGYKIDKLYEGKGFMKEALLKLIDYAFNSLSLRRLEANVVPWNKRSRTLLGKLGFVEIGEDDQYLVIDGKPTPHVLTSLINKNWKKD